MQPISQSFAKSPDRRFSTRAPVSPVNQKTARSSTRLNKKVSLRDFASPADLSYGNGMKSNTILQTAINSPRTLKTSQSSGLIFHAPYSPVVNGGKEEREREVEALKAQVRVLSSTLHKTRVERLNPEMLKEEITSETIKSLNLDLAKKKHSLGAIEKIIRDFQVEIQEKDLVISPECKCKMEEILKAIDKSEKNVLVRETVREYEKQTSEKVVVIYREDGGEEDWRVWRRKWEESELRITKLNYEIEQLYEHQNQMVIERSRILEERNILEVNLKNLELQMSQFSRSSMAQGVKFGDIENEKASLYKQRDEVVRQLNLLKNRIVEFEVKESHYVSEITTLKQELAQFKQVEDGDRRKSDDLTKLVKQTQAKIISDMSQNKNLNLMKVKLDQANSRILHLQTTNSMLQQRLSDRKGNYLNVGSSGQVGELSRKNFENIQRIKQLEQRLINNSFDLQTLEMMKPRMLTYEKTIENLKGQLAKVEGQQQKQGVEIERYSARQVLERHTEIRELIERNRQTIVMLERKIEDLETGKGSLDVNKEIKTNYDQSASGSDIFSVVFNPEAHENANISTHETTPEEEKVILQFTKNLFLHTENEEIIKNLKVENEEVKLDLEHARRDLEQIRHLHENPQQRDEVMEQLNIGKKILQKDISELYSKLEDKEFTIAQLGQAIKVLQEKKDIHKIVTDHALFKEAVNRIRKLNLTLKDLYEEKDNLLLIVNKKGAIEVDLRCAQQRIMEIEEEKRTIMTQFEEIRGKLLMEIREKDQVIRSLRLLVKEGHHGQGKGDEYFRYKADPRYLELKKKLYELHKAYNVHNEVTHEFFSQYQKEHLQSHQTVLELIRQTFAILKKFEQTIIVKKSELRSFNVERLRQLKGRLNEMNLDGESKLDSVNYEFEAILEELEGKSE